MSKKPNDIIKYSGLGIQMILIIMIFSYLGNMADNYFHNERSYITLLGMLFGVVGSIINLIRQLNKDSKND